MRSADRNVSLWVLMLVALVIVYASLIGPMAEYMRHKPFVEKIGLLPRVEILKFASADQKQLIAESLIFKVLVYFGGLMEVNDAKVQVPADYQAMSRMIHGCVQLDPYNMDAYYFAQSILVWDVKQIQIANNLLEYGMRYRTWDWYLPYFAGFNYAYFLKDYASAAKYYQRTAAITGDVLFMNLASRYLNQSNQTGLALSYLSMLIKSEKSAAIKKVLTLRLRALQGVRVIEIARDSFLKNTGRVPSSLDDLVRSGYLRTVPIDPYGGRFYLDPDLRVKSSSKFSLPVEKGQQLPGGIKSNARH